MSDEEQASYEALRGEYEKLEEEHAEELPDEVDIRLGEIETAMEALQKPSDPLREGRARHRRRVRQHRRLGAAARRTSP